MSPGKHRPNPRLSSYLAVHATNMEQAVRGGFVTVDGLVVSAQGRYIEIAGTIECLGGITITVAKLVEILSATAKDPPVQTAIYSYNVSLNRVGNIFRYDSPDPVGDRADAPPHHSEHHVHRFDVLNGDRRGTIDCIYDLEQVPTLREVIEEAEQWYYAHLDSLP